MTFQERHEAFVRFVDRWTDEFVEMLRKPEPPSLSTWHLREDSPLDQLYFRVKEEVAALAKRKTP